MRIKKCFAIFSLMMIMCLSVLPSFASASGEELLKGKTIYTSLDFNTPVLVSGKPLTGDVTNQEFNIGRNTVDVRYVDFGSEKNVNYFQVYLYGEDAKKYTPSFNLKFYDKNKKEIYSDENKFFNVGTVGKTINVRNARYVSYTYISGYDVNVKVPVNSFRMTGTDVIPLSDITNLRANEGVNDVSFTWENPKDSGFTGVKIFKEGSFVADVEKNVNSYQVKELEANKNYNFEFVAMYGEDTSKGIQKGIKTLVDPKTIPPGPVSSLTAEPTDKTVKLKWKKPKDDDLAGFKILQNGKQVAEIGLVEEFTVKNLQPLTDYNFGVIAVDRDKNDSSPVNLSVKTLEENDDEPPLVPSNVFAKPSSGALIASWDKVSDKDLAGYNVYVDDKKVNSNLISSTNFTIKNLENNRKYKIQVQAVDRSGNASALSLAAYGTPDENTIPIIESNYSLQDVSDGVSVMFGQFWTVLAFAVGIPLAFYIIYKLKLTVLP
ncbi:fibronectin type III domain-containing protein [Bacillus wiedmannii]|uniref:fibronectin type III domain-containing protein n=1 Tax=Bacillus wiedmannii TaxID=1890302 RepID=UPI0039FC2541